MLSLSHSLPSFFNRPFALFAFLLAILLNFAVVSLFSCAFMCVHVCHVYVYAYVYIIIIIILLLLLIIIITISALDALVPIGEQYFPKYLTSTKLLSLQMRDPAFRRHIMLQCLILFKSLDNIAFTTKQGTMQ
jgi:hypothetical protein